jgi:hypothetical protein
MLTVLAPFLLLALYVGLVAAVGQSERGVALWLKSTVIVAAGRIGLLWVLLALHWRGLLGLWAMPFILLLLPEGLLLPPDFAWTVSRGILVTGLLAAGTALWTGLAMAVVRALRAVARPSARPRC